jgi:alkylated DNA repair protein (DNA oxidative demethylase)
MTNCGTLGWVTDEAGYRYQALHPQTGQPWAAMPARVLEAWNALAHYPHPAECCLINYYDATARMGLHQDRDEHDFDAPVVSLSLGDTCLFRVGGTKRSDPTCTLRLPPVMRWCLAGTRGSPSTAWTASVPEAPGCCRREAGSISR